MAFNIPGDFIPTTNIWDVSEIYDIDVTSPEFKELLIRLYQNINNISVSLNTRDSGYYPLNSYVNGQLYFPNQTAITSTSSQVLRQVYRIVVDFGALPNTGAKSVAHNIPVTTAFTFTRIYGTATDPVGLNFIPLPYSSPTLANNIELSANSTNVTVTTGSNRSAFTITFIVLEYITQ